MRNALCLLAVLLLARPVRAEEPPAPPSPEEVGRLLLADDPAERARGEAALIEAVRRDADLAGFVRRLAEALRALAMRNERVHEAPAQAPSAPPRPVPTEAQEEAHDEGAKGGAPAPVLQPDPLAEAPQVAAPPAPPTTKPAPPAGARAKVAPWTLKLWTVSVLERELESLLPKVGINTPIVGSKSRDGASHTYGPAEWAPAWAQGALRSADAVPLGEASLELWPHEQLVRHLGSEVRYRRVAVPSKGGGWAVETDVVRAGLTLAVRLEGDTLDLETTWVNVAQPMATESTRPAPSVGPIELDRPEWDAARRASRSSVPAEGRAGLMVLPGLLPAADRRLVLVYSLLPR